MNTKFAFAYISRWSKIGFQDPIRSRSGAEGKDALCLLLAGSIIFVVFLSAAFAGDNKWTSNGPYGGFFQTFTFHPKLNHLIFAGGWIPGLFRSQNGGQSWQRLQVSGWNTIVRIHPRNAGAIIASSYQVFRSTDNGTSWESLGNSPFQRDSFQDLEFDPVDPQILYGITWENGVFKSTDGGRTWAAANTGLKFDCTTKICGRPQLEIDPTDGKNIFVLTRAAVVWKSTNGGKSWKQANKGIDFSDWTGNSLAIDPKNPEILYAAGSKVFKTTNAGREWFSPDGGTFWGAWMITVDPKDTRNLYLAGHGVAKSTDAGRTWTELSLQDDLLGVAVHPRKNKIVFLGAFGQGIYRSENGGSSWQPASTGLDAQWISQMHSHPKRLGKVFAVAGTKTLYESTDGGKTWELSPPSKGEDHIMFVRDVQVHPQNANLIVIAVADSRGAVYLSNDGGKNWTFGAASYQDATGVAFDPQNPNTLYLAPFPTNQGGSDPLGIAKSTDQGNTWKLINSGLPEKSITAITVDPQNSQNLWVGTSSGKIFASANAGLKWKDSSAGLALNAGRVESIVVDPANTKVVYCVTGGFIYKSTDGGRKWVVKNNGIRPNERVNFAALDPDSGALFAGGFGILFLSTDRADNWTSFDGNGLGLFRVMKFIRSSLPDTFLIGTERGIFSYTRTGSPGGPIIEQLSPAVGKVGDTVALIGSNFGTTQADSKVLFGSVDAGASLSWTDTRVSVRVPSGARTGPVTVTVANRKSNGFEFILLPASGNIEPTSGPAAGGTRVTILAPSGVSGTQFNVLFGASLASNIRFTPPNIITCTSPPGAGTVDVSVTSSAIVSKVGTFTYQ